MTIANITALLGALGKFWWPLAVVIVAALYKTELRLLLPRLRRAGPTGVEFDPADAQKAGSEKPSTTEPGKLAEFRGITRTPAIERTERQLHAALENMNMPPDEKSALLVRLLAQAQLEAAFERIFNLIFGSQILALRRLNERNHVTIDEAKEYFEVVTAPFSDFYKNYGFEGWLGFLIGNGLVARDGNLIQITDLGRDFLLYLTSRRLAENKPG
jgi:hypothetical protein